MAADFQIKVLTPAGLIFEDRASMVTLPAIDGEIGILPQHTKYTGLLGTGVIIYENGSITKKLVVSGGFCNFVGETLTIIADYVKLPEDVEKSTYANERGSLQKLINTSDSVTTELAAAKEKLARIEAIDRLLGSSGH